MPSPAPRPVPLAPGARVLIRDEEWIVRRVDRAHGGGFAISATGISELVRDQDFIFLSTLDPHEPIVPERTKLVTDNSPGYRSSLLHIESRLRRTPPTSQNIHVGHKAAMDVIPFQLEPTLMALDQPRPRLLIADAVGLGKTLEAGILMSELIRRGRGKRILVVTLKSMLTQFQKELWSRFTIPLVRLDSVGIQRVRSKIPSNHNPFHHFDRAIISIDTLKDARDYRAYIEQAYWDIIVIDEAHNVADRGGQTLRSNLAKLLSERSDALIMLSATPHDGKARSFASLVHMLDPTAIADADNYTRDELEGKQLFVRRFKKDIKHQILENFPEREIILVKTSATRQEEYAYQLLVETPAEVLTRRGAGASLFRTVLEKALFSSPPACLRTIERRIKNLGRDNADRSADIGALERIADALRRIDVTSFAKYQKLLHVIRESGWTGNDSNDRLVIFTERIDTMEFLGEHLAKDLGLGKDAIITLDGRMTDVRQQEVVEAFGQGEAKVRLLIASDVASEGINLHYLCHRMIHFDIPWSLMVFQQRNGRIDRYGQRQVPYITYLITESQQEKIKGDSRILELLVEKERQAHENIGDPAAIMGAYDVQEEEKRVAEAIEKGMTVEEAERHFLGERKKEGMQEEELDPLTLLMGTANEGDNQLTRTGSLLSIYDSDYRFLKEALAHISANRTQDGLSAFQSTFDDARRIATLVAPEDLKRRYRTMPREARPDKDTFVLSPDPGSLMREFDRCRREEEAWPKIQYLWSLHPVLDWATDKVSMTFGRQEAPVIHLASHLGPEDIVFVISGLIPNRKGHPLLHEWFAIQFDGNEDSELIKFEELLARWDLGHQSIANAGPPKLKDRAGALLPRAIRWARQYMSQEHASYKERQEPKLQQHLIELYGLKTKHLMQLDLELDESGQPEAMVEARRAEAKREKDRVFDSYVAWIKETMKTEDEPYIEVVAVFAGR